MPCPCVLVQPALQILVSQIPVLPFLASSFPVALSLLPARFNLHSIAFHCVKAVTSDSARKPCWLPPCDAHLLFSSWRRRERSKRRSTRQPICRSWSCQSVPANTAATSEWPAIAAGKDLLPQEPGSSRRRRAEFLLPVAASRSRPPY